MTRTTSPAPLDPHRLVDALERLRGDGVLTAAQVSSVLAAVGDGAPARSVPGAGGRLVEAAAYAGGVLVAASGMLLVAQRWESLGRDGRVAVLLGVTLLLAVVGVAVALLRPRGRTALLQPGQSVRRRLASTVLSGAALSAAGTVALMDPDRSVPAALTAVVLMVVVQWRTPSVVSEVVTLGALIWLAGAVLALGPARGAVVVLVHALIGSAWSAASRTPAITAPVPALALGLLVVLGSGTVGTWDFDTSSEGAGVAVLVTLALVGLVLFVRGGRWPLAAAGAGALAALVMDISSDSLGPVVGVMLSGILLLALALFLVLLGRRRSAPIG